MINIHAKYTVVLKELMDNPEVMSKIDEAMSTYEIYTPTSKHEYIPNCIPTRSELNKKILNHYKYREIGFETVGRFLDELKIALEEIMPYYNQLMFTQDQDFNIIYNVDYKRNIERNRDGERSNTSTGENTTTMNGETSDTSIVENESTGTTQGTDSHTTQSSLNHDSKKVQSKTPQDELSITAKNIDSFPFPFLPEFTIY